jgi:hypothetical protein
MSSKAKQSQKRFPSENGVRDCFVGKNARLATPALRFACQIVPVQV